MRNAILISLLLAGGALAPGKDVRGKVTYVAAGTIYTSLGAEFGVKDSSIMYVLSNRDTIAVLRVIAVSSKSSSSIVVSSRSKIAVDDIVVGMFNVRAQVAADSSSRPDTTLRAASAVIDSTRKGEPRKVVVAPPVSVQGRVSAQYFSTRYYDENSNSTQPSFTLNLKATARDIPLSFETYGNYRSLAYGSAGLFSGGSINQSRLYRLALQYNDGVTAAMIGRFTPSAAPTVGYLDGLLVSRTFGHFIIGSAAGFQSKITLNGLNTAYKKISVFTNYQTQGPLNVYASTAYTRNYFHFLLDRELLSALVSISTPGGFGFYFNGDLDFRQKKGEQFVLSPLVTNCNANFSYPVASFLSLSVGGNVSRWYSDYSLIQFVPDTLIDRSARGGVSFGVNIFTIRGINFTNTYNPRSSTDGFGKEYTNVSSLMFSNVFSTGVMFRTNANFTANQYSSSRGIGFGAERSFLNTLQFSFSFQRSTYTVKSLQESDVNTSFTIDALWFVTRDLSLTVDYNRLDGFGRVSKNIFTELSYRF